MAISRRDPLIIMMIYGTIHNRKTEKQILSFSSEANSRVRCDKTRTGTDPIHTQTISRAASGFSMKMKQPYDMGPYHVFNFSGHTY